MMASKKTSKKSTTHEHQEFYVGLIESATMQRELLEARKNALVLLKRLEKAMLIREQRIYLEGELRTAIGAISAEIERVMSSLPDLPKEPVAPVPKPQEAPKAAPKPAPEQKQVSELDRKLAEIDKRLADLQ